MHSRKRRLPGAPRRRSARAAGIVIIVIALICFKTHDRDVCQCEPMKISSVTCPHCHAAYEIAESTSALGSPGQADCGVCGTLLVAWEEPSLRAFRLVVPPEHKYPRVPTPSCFA